jgi:hypothetical protein
MDERSTETRSATAREEIQISAEAGEPPGVENHRDGGCSCGRPHDSPNDPVSLRKPQEAGAAKFLKGLDTFVFRPDTCTQRRCPDCMSRSLHRSW